MRLAVLLAVLALFMLQGTALPGGIAFQPGPTNTVTIGSTAVYGVPAGIRRVRRVLLTHARRELIPDSPGASSAEIHFVVPAAERELFEDPARFWTALETDRFHDYAQRSTKVPVAPVPVARGVSDGDGLEEGDARIRVIGTPGYTPGAVSYLIEAGGSELLARAI